MRSARRLAALAAAACALSAQADCRAPDAAASLGLAQSRWQEIDADGSELVQERGVLALQTLDIGLRCDTLRWQAQWQQLQGQRDYDGQTSSGAAARSTSGLRIRRLQLQALYPLNSQWSLGLRARATDIDRDIAGTAQALGYPEHFQYWQAGLGAQFSQAFSERSRLLLEAWFGFGPGGRLRLRLPVADEAELALGASRAASLQLAWEGEFETSPQWSWHTGLLVSREAIDAGAPSALLRNGVPFGAARQPRTVQSEGQWRAGLQYRF